MKDKFITIILFCVMLLNSIDVYVDIGLGVPTAHVIEEAMIVLISGLAAIFLIFDMRKRSIKLEKLATQLKNADTQIRSLNDKMDEERAHFSEVIKQQFEQWNLTKGEQQVAFLLLKGLSLKEISVVRNTKEATVRQQASSIYSKSLLDGRHEFSAWFIEDLFMDQYT
jgi:DNA-binding NarL/FixJ family response regulator